MAMLTITRDFQAPTEQLYKAWTEPAALKQWWKPLGKELIEVQNDIREGGIVKYSFGENESIEGQYEQAEIPNLLKYSWNWHFGKEPIHDVSYTLTVKFGGTGDQSSLTIQQEGFDADAATDIHRQGWEQALDQLDLHLQEAQQVNASLPDQEPAPISG